MAAHQAPLSLGFSRQEYWSGLPFPSPPPPPCCIAEAITTEDEMARWHHQLDAHEFGWTLGVGDGQGGLACCDSWDHKASDTTERLNWTELKWSLVMIICDNIIFFKKNSTCNAILNSWKKEYTNYQQLDKYLLSMNPKTLGSKYS